MNKIIYIENHPSYKIQEHVEVIDNEQIKHQEAYEIGINAIMNKQITTDDINNLLFILKDEANNIKMSLKSHKYHSNESITYYKNILKKLRSTIKFVKLMNNINDLYMLSLSEITFVLSILSNKSKSELFHYFLSITEKKPLSKELSNIPDLSLQLYEQIVIIKLNKEKKSNDNSVTAPLL